MPSNNLLEYKYATITVTLHIRRKPLYYILNLIVPCGLISIVAASTFLLQPSCEERLGLSK